MADGDKTFTEQEHLAILTDRVAKETADSVSAREKAEQERDELQNKLDVAESAKVAAEQRATTAEGELVEFKTGIETLAQQEAKKDERVTELKEVAAHLGDDFFTDEKRIARVVAMDDEGFAAYRDDLKSTAPAPGTTAPGVAPRETAMSGANSTGAGGNQPSAARGVFLGRYPGADTNKEG